MFFTFRCVQIILLSIVVSTIWLYVISNSSLTNTDVKRSSESCEVCRETEIYIDDICARSFIAEHKAKGTSYRTIARLDFPPENLPGWNVTQTPEVPVPRFPKALILGFAKCGTAALVAFLPLHPDIVTIDWEIDYFCDRMYFYYDLHWYRMRMPASTSSQVTIEKSPCYLRETESLRRMYAFNSSLKVMMTVRHPVTRLLSRYAQEEATNVVFGVQPRTLEQYIFTPDGRIDEETVKKWAVYSDIAEAVYNVFPSDQIHIIDGDLLITDPLDQLRQIETFLGIQHYFSEQDVYFDPDKGFYCMRHRTTGQTECMGSSKGRRHIEISESLNITLKNYFRPFNERFFLITGRRFNWD